MRPVPYVSQIDGAPANNDCGPACVLMLARWIDPATTATVADLARALPKPRHIDPTDDGTTAGNLAAALSELELTPTRGGSGYPYIALVTYNKLPRNNRRVEDIGIPHWIVRLDADRYHDPYHEGQRGANLFAGKAVLDAAERGVSYRVGIVERPREVIEVSYKAREPYDRVVHVVPQECTAAQFDTVQAVAFGVRQGIVFSVDDACLPIEGLRSRKLIFWGVPAANQQSYRDFVAAWYPAPEIPTVIEFREFSGPPSTRPTIQFSGQPLTIVAGQSSQLDWVVMNANSVKLGGEVVTAQGSRTVKPASTTIYALTATGAGGTAQSNVMITVTPVTPPPPPVSKTVFTVTVLAGGPLAAVAAGTHEVLTKKAQSAISALEELSPARGPGVLRDVAIGNYAQAMFEAQGLAQSQGALSIGLPGVCIKFNPAQAKDLVPRFPGRLVIVEPYMVGGETSIGYWMDRTELGSLPPGTVVTGCNEEDHGHPSGTPRGIQTRSEFDYAAWGECKKRGLIYAGGGWALGGPNVVDPAIVQAMRNYYAPLVNGGMWLNQHSYMGKDGSTTDQPLMGRFAHKYPVTLGGKTFTISQAWWTALRLKFYTAICGMDPRKANFIATEGGIEGDDKMSPALISGGFNANQNVDMVAYLKAVRAAFDEPWWFGDTNTWHTSPLRAYCVFCANSPNEHDKWYGYDISQRIGQLLLV